MDIQQQTAAVWASFRRLPSRVQAWVGLLCLVNILWIFLLDTPTGRYAGLATLFVVATNIPIMYITGGISKLLSIPHLIAWVPLVLFLLLSLLGNTPMGAGEAFYAAALLVVNGVSLLFDARDSWAWLQGDRGVP